VLAADPHVPKEVDDALLPVDEVIERSDLLIVATPHAEFKNIVTDKPVADVWNLLGHGVVI
jgi:UDP-N-acetyl-D-mannosaminuronic acid dehydrogenase